MLARQLAFPKAQGLALCHAEVTNPRVPGVTARTPDRQLSGATAGGVNDRYGGAERTPFPLLAPKRLRGQR
ncbi:hypothetical protein AGR4B_pAt20396 [Agrobacterium tumefaciens str. CFBP 5621]|nr:hypothetical protein AGR4B_pAt20396 [Agrobacterium tumefaciens str. CFBP 5621]